MAPDSPKRSASVRRCYHETERFRTCLTNPAPLRDNPRRSVCRTSSVFTPQQEEGAGRADTNPINALQKGKVDERRRESVQAAGPPATGGVPRVHGERVPPSHAGPGPEEAE